ncbi:hypothetical protein V6L78_24520 [Pseudomonas canadensis]|uniref:hypothetical protein n=1 Tax=Pseudomonas canadensis TaxID=915099 RepID=UPI0030CE7CAD
MYLDPNQKRAIPVKVRFEPVLDGILRKAASKTRMQHATYQRMRPPLQNDRAKPTSLLGGRSGFVQVDKLLIEFSRLGLRGLEGRIDCVDALLAGVLYGLAGGILGRLAARLGNCC